MRIYGRQVPDKQESGLTALTRTDYGVPPRIYAKFVALLRLAIDTAVTELL